MASHSSPTHHSSLPPHPALSPAGERGKGEGALEKVTVGLIQMRCDPQPEANLDKAVARIRQAASDGAQIICLPELFRSQYFCQRQDPSLFDLAEPIPGPSTERLGQVARETGTVIIASLFERRAAGVYHNTAAVIDADGKLLGIYRKMHIPDDPLYYEKYYFTPGDLGFRTFDTRFGKIGVLVCWDQWYPEAARLTALQGAQIIFYPTAIGWHPREKAEFGAAQHQAWELIQRSHGLANGVYVAAVNRVGHENNSIPSPLGGEGRVRGEPAKDGLEFWGASFVSDPFGGVLKRADHQAEENLIVTCDLKRLEEIRRHWPFLRDRRIDAYGDITRRMID
jgi:N-carbamoylputrescine amidase